MLRDAEGIDLLVARQSDSKRKHEPYVEYLISSMRKRIETTFSEISNFLPKKIHAVTEFGFLLKVVYSFLDMQFQEPFFSSNLS